MRPPSLCATLSALLLYGAAARLPPTFTHGFGTALESQFIDYGYSTLTPQQAAFVASHYAIVSLEKCTGPGHAAKQGAAAAQARPVLEVGSRRLLPTLLLVVRGALLS